MKTTLSNIFKKKDLGAVRTCLGIEVPRLKSERKLTITQISYSKRILERFRMLHFKPVNIPMEKSPLPADIDGNAFASTIYTHLIESLMHPMIFTHPDFGFSVYRLSKRF